jgi:hypothetical protein
VVLDQQDFKALVQVQQETLDRKEIKVALVQQVHQVHRVQEGHKVLLDHLGFKVLLETLDQLVQQGAVDSKVHRVQLVQTE